MAVCKGCGAEIEFVKTPSGKLNPISLATGESHFIDCPARDRFRKPARTAAKDRSLNDN